MEAKRKGSIALVICSSFISPIAHAMKRHTPTGGVVSPITRLSTMITPKWSGSTPILFIRGSNTGVKIISEAVVSMNVPTISKSIFTRRRIAMRLWVKEITNSVKYCGISSLAKIHEKILAVPITSITSELVTAEFIIIFGRSASLISRYTNRLMMRA